MTRPRYLTKSRFKLACECPAKLFYTGKIETYPDMKLDDSFLAALAEGGYQVGELAKYYYPGGTDITTLDYEQALAETAALLEQENVVIYEAAIRHEKLFIRVDVLVKRGDILEIIEVKAKSFDPTEPSPFLTKRKGTLTSGWKSYLYDVAFQKHVVQSAFPGMSVTANLMLADKSSRCPVDGLNQKFRLAKEPGSNRKRIVVSEDLNAGDLAEKILVKVPVDEYCNLIYSGKDVEPPASTSFVDRVNKYAHAYAIDKKIIPEPQIGSRCAKCEFKTTSEQGVAGKRSGFKECWGDALGWSNGDFEEPTVLDIWNFRRKDELIAQGKVRLSSIEEADIRVKSDDQPGISSSERQWLQIEKATSKDSSPWIDVDGLQAEMDSWVYPLHFIDFETTMVALPFNAGRRPYEGIAFQFSHHVVYEDGRIEHKGQYLNTERGVFPNYEFLRALKNELDGDEGTVFRYATHENTFLNHIYRQLTEDAAPPSDKVELLTFIRSITKSVKSSPDEWVGDRNMVDMLELVKRYYYDPETGGSNSIKQVLPAILASSQHLQGKYSKPIYGSAEGIPSLNFKKGWSWIQFHGSQVKNPYKLLPNMFEDISK
jgi:hypothetical protein